ncbi:MAG TPA: AAA family ATPase [Spirochaetota bacterium]|nr:AAA family ATPase [Spirochaetota bacterium]HPI88818.1 AAA family ATPase [Spirochaetota bacterium]HPR47694.1 AAA family ATPase [Spirochaetota bacterium]
MVSGKKYLINEIIYDDKFTEVFRGASGHEGEPVIIKLHKNPHLTIDETHKFEYEFYLMRDYDIPCIVRPLNLDSIDGKSAIIMEGFSGVTVAEYVKIHRPTLLELIGIFIKMAACLGSLHEHKLIHRNVQPNCFLFNGKEQELKIFNFSNATKVIREMQVPCNPQKIEGNLDYISPEQTGLMNRSIDYRSDYYSLGVSLYELTAGALPFMHGDHMELVHSHIAKRPLPPCKVNSSIPQVLSDVILQLMAKRAEDRYQSIAGLVYDLEKIREQISLTGNATEFTIGEKDGSAHFKISEKLYGRENETKKLNTIFESVCNGTLNAVMVNGEPGIGKSFLINELHRPLVSKKGIFISGKFDSMKRNLPFYAFISAVRDLIRQILTEKDEVIDFWRKRILSVTGKYGKLLLDFIPELELIIGKQAEVELMGPIESKNRFNRLFIEFLNIFADRKHPLVLFLDDMQWIDSDSINLLDALLDEGNLRYFLFIGSYRTNEVEPSTLLHLLMDLLKKKEKMTSFIELQPFHLNDMVSLIADSLNLRPEQCAELSRVVMQKTGGNPFFTREFLTTLYNRNYIFYDDGWLYDIDRISRSDVSDNLADHMTQRVQSFPLPVIKLLKVGASIGGTFDINLLSIITGSPEKSITEDLLEVINQGLLIKTGKSFKFTHDKILAAVYSLSGREEREITHYMIGMAMLKTGNSDEGNIFSMVNHLNIAAGIISSDQEKEELAHLNYTAGIRAKQSTAYDAAYSFFMSGFSLLSQRAWFTNYDLALELHVECGEACVLVGRYDEAEKFFDEVMHRGGTIHDKIRIYEVKISHYIMQHHPEKSLKIGKQALNLLGMPMPDRASLPLLLKELLMVKLFVTGKKMKKVFSGPEMHDPTQLAIMRLLISIAEPSYLVDPQYLPVIICRMIRFSVKHGMSKYSSFAFVSYGLLLCGVLNRFREGARFGKFALDLLEKFTDQSLRAKILYIYGNMVSLWRNPLRQSFPYLFEAFKVGRENGDHSYAAYAINNYNLMSLFAGERLDEVIADYSRYYSIVKKFYLPAMTSAYELWWQMMINLGSETLSNGIISGDITSESLVVPEMVENENLNPLGYYSVGKMMLLFLSQKYEEAGECARQGAAYLDSVAGTMLVPEYYFYYAMVLVQLLKRNVRHRGDDKSLKKAREKLQRFAKECRDNFSHLHYLVEASYCHFRGKKKKAEILFQKAVSAAYNNGFIHDYAISCEFFARFCLDCGKDTKAGQMLVNAYDAYRQWGAEGKAAAVEQEFGKFLSTIKGRAGYGDPSTDRYAFLESIDLMSLVKANQAISMEIILDKLLEKLLKVVVQNSGAERGVLLLANEDVLTAEAEYQVDADDFILLESQPVDIYKALPLSLLNYVKRTSQEVVINRPEDNMLFDGDDYFNDRREYSILCIPLTRQKAFKGMIYLENTLNTDVFRHERIELVKMIATQAVISLENAILFEKSRQAEMEMEQQYEEIQAQYEEMETLHEDLEETFQELSETNRKLAREKEQLGTTLRSIAEGVITTDQTGRIALINKGAEDILGIPHIDAVGRFIRDVVVICDSETGRCLDDPVTEVLNQGESLDIKSEVYIQGVDGEKRFVSVSCAPVKFETGSILGSVMVIQDLTERKLMEDEMVKSSKIESLGIFAGGIAHDFNNILTSIVGNLSLLKLQTQKSAMDQDILSDIEKASLRARDLTQQLLTFSKGGAPIKKITSVRELVSETADFVMRGSAVKCNFLFSEHLWNIEADEGQISQVIHNLVLNARQAMNDTGEIWIRVQNYTALPGDHGFMSGDYIRIIIRDEGEGIPEGVIQRIFDPYFTTKKNGSGLGLAISYSIIKKHGGHIQVESDGKHGTTFEIYLPATTRNVAHETSLIGDITFPGGTLLLMDDDEMVLKVGERLFSKLGFEVHPVGNGEEAVEAYNKALQDGRPFTLVVMDLTVPGGMGGREAVSILRREHPGAKIIVSSGYSNDPVMAQYREYGFDGVIVKPYRLSELRMALFEVLGDN